MILNAFSLYKVSKQWEQKDSRQILSICNQSFREDLLVPHACETDFQCSTKMSTTKEPSLESLMDELLEFITDSTSAKVRENSLQGLLPFLRSQPHIVHLEQNSLHKVVDSLVSLISDLSDVSF